MGIDLSLNKLNVSKRKINAIEVIFLLLFMILANFTQSVIRACIMAILRDNFSECYIGKII